MLQRALRRGLLLGPDGDSRDHDTVMELTCRFDLRKGVFFIQPGFEYIIRPGGTGRLKNALVFGTQFGINF